ncbi:iron-siderophore ABC transporter substrate-binding protein [Aliivibrio fischeri]|uniref:ABC transporter substrate-binding protein n=1 Tax=Aliivibrio fischeri TaxID=668 RepID=A0A6N3YS84_ALIFS|nr:iron-siderophore ABC transporter substrate-binding protein [Aliivibrio fischeri]MCE7555429.1 iron-siderophore ABC transporter substrate-binding protein [Aliivibrio fischeri]MCE7562697.1 iron-siderophore ABC transporter substrate-binding protein [Aliivibrio fischeri]MCE7565807.1 iron-siderophore ABC transporter substrate-binding protein [Aliivibrio fischeri]MCE7570105.1 iron-siderophore ABC transporter substrate-binding protein [Aliivibrio fischeri]MUK43762.1 ABC transporter substrate-bindin
MYKVISLIMLVLYAMPAQTAEIKHELGITEITRVPQKIVVLDWVLAETVLSLGVEPLGVADAKGYRSWVMTPKLPSNVLDVGSRREPNLELLTELNPDVILISQHMSAMYEKLNTIAPTLVYTVYSNEKTPLIAAKDITIQLGRLLDKEQRALQLIEQTEKILTENGNKIRQHQEKPLLFVRFINDKTVRIHSEGSLAQSTINAMGLTNAWHEPTNLWGFTTAGIEKLAQYQQANVLIFGPLKEDDKVKLTQSTLWQAMAFTRTDSVYELPAIWTFGGLISAQRFSNHITQQLTQ